MFLQSAEIVSAAGGSLLRLMDEEQLQHQDSKSPMAVQPISPPTPRFQMHIGDSACAWCVCFNGRLQCGDGQVYLPTSALVVK